MTDEERAILEALDTAVLSESTAGPIGAVVERVRSELALRPEAVMTWEPISLAIYGKELPPVIKSSWVFVLRAGVNTGAERHPNSHQRMMCFEGSGDMQIRRDVNSPWKSNVLQSDSSAVLEQRWISIPQNVWHQPVVPADSDWVVVSFHTVPAEELIEERPDPKSDTGTKQMTYLEG
jgi:hypothetical protein